jgi:histone H3/H4
MAAWTNHAMEALPQEDRETPLLTEEDPDAPERKKRRTKREFSIPKDAIRRLIREITQNRKSDLKFQEGALDTLHEMSENMLTGMFHRCSRLSKLCKTSTLNEQHLKFVCGDLTLLG